MWEVEDRVWTKKPLPLPRILNWYLMWLPRSLRERFEVVKRNRRQGRQTICFGDLNWPCRVRRWWTISSSWICSCPYIQAFCVYKQMVHGNWYNPWTIEISLKSSGFRKLEQGSVKFSVSHFPRKLPCFCCHALGECSFPKLKTLPNSCVQYKPLNLVLDLE